MGENEQQSVYLKTMILTLKLTGNSGFGIKKKIKLKNFGHVTNILSLNMSRKFYNDKHEIQWWYGKIQKTDWIRFQFCSNFVPSGKDKKEKNFERKKNILFEFEFE